MTPRPPSSTLIATAGVTNVSQWFRVVVSIALAAWLSY
jgi:hypothetical protein